MALGKVAIGWSRELPTRKGLYIAFRYGSVNAVVVRKNALTLEAEFPQGVVWRLNDTGMPKGYEWYGPISLPPPFELSDVEDESLPDRTT